VHDAAQELVLNGNLLQFPSYFEILTAQAFLYFAGSQVEIAILEVGMGGRLDATNIVDPLLSIITDISLDHMEWLGSTIAAITREKAGILRRGGTMITLPQHPDANRVLGEVAAELDVRGVSAVPYMPGMAKPVAAAGESYWIEALGAPVKVDSPLTGAHQHRNLALAIAAAVELATHHGFPITASSITDGIQQTRWPARLERIQVGDVSWILDVAHNPAGAWALRAGLSAFPSASMPGDHAPRVLIFSCLRDKPVAEMAQILFPLFDLVLIPPIKTARAAQTRDIVAAAEATGTAAEAVESVAEALRVAGSRAGDGQIVVSGSVYLVGEARALLLQLVRDHQEDRR
jgi:dihydrofolate synthase/folylpolyglutamate synthase